MNLFISGKNFDLGEALREKASHVVQRVVAKYFDHAVDAHITFDKKTEYQVSSRVEVHIGHNIIIRASDAGSDAYTALDQSVHMLEKNLRRYKERLKAHHSNHDVSKEEKAMQYVLDDVYRNFDEDTETTKHAQAAVVAETTTYIPYLSVSEAVMRLDLSDSHAFLFKNKAHGQLNLVYTRKDGNIGWVDPEGNKALHEKNK